jgi:DNA-binding response OmpR family regulator
MKNILLVEDTAHLAEEILDVLRLEGFNARVASGGMQALAFINETRPDLIITDLLMPVIDGFQLIERIRSMDSLKAIPIIILSAKASEEDKARGIQAGADYFLVKPCKSHQLIEAIKTLLTRTLQ